MGAATWLLIFQKEKRMPRIIVCHPGRRRRSGSQGRV